ncbi:MAG TPA: AsmA family protein [Methylomirabilota bacterium]
MKRYVKWVAVAVAALVVVIVAAFVALPLLVDTPRVQALIASNASHALGRPVKFAGVSVVVFPLPSVELRGLEVAEDPKFGTEPFLKLETGRLRLRLLPLLTGRVEFGELVLKKPQITLVQSADGHWNVASLGATRDSGTASRPPGSEGRGGVTAGGAGLVSKVTIDHGVVVYVTQGGGGSKYRVEDLDLTLTGSPSAVGFKGGARVMPGDLAVKITDGTVALGGARTYFDAPVRGRVAVETKSLGTLAATAMGSSPALGGSMKGALTLAGTVGKPNASGDIQLSDFAVTQMQPHCPDPKQRTLAFAPVKLNATYEETRFGARPLTTGIGGGTITTNVVATLDRGLHVALNDLGIKSLPLEKVLVDYLCQGYAVSGPLELTGALTMRAADIWHTLSGPGQLRIGPGKIVGPQALALLGGVTKLGGAVSSLASADLPPSLFESPVDFESITGTYQATNGVITTRDLLYTSRVMKVAVAGAYTLASGAMDLDMIVSYQRGAVKAKVTGTAASPSIRVDPVSVLKDVDPAKVERGLQDLLKRFK